LECPTIERLVEQIVQRAGIARPRL
jgi:hypothetical protein